MRYTGAIVKRREDPRLLAGLGAFLDDLRPDGCLHAAFVRSAYAHARVRGLDGAAAREGHGVAAVLTGRDLAGMVAPLAPRLEGPGFFPTEWRALAPDVARFAGEPLAAVAAGDPYVASDAAEGMAADLEPLPAVADVDAARAPGAPRLHEGVPGNILFRRRHTRGDVDGAFARAAHRVGESFSHGRVSASPLEPRGLVARWEGDRLTVWAGTQVPHIFRAALATCFGLDPGAVRVIVPDTGGGFGQKMHVLPEDLAVVALARATGRPVKWLETRRENLAAASQAREARAEVEVAADARGVVLGLRARVVSDAGAYHIYPLTQALEPLGVANIIPGPYRTPAYAWEAEAVATNKPPLGAYRGVGMSFGAFIMERLLDLLAERLGIDPVEIRRRNLIPPDAYPFTSASGFVYDSGDYPRALADALAAAGYERLRAEQATGRATGRLLGVGVSCYTESTGIGSRTYRGRGMREVPGPEAASVSVDATGRVRCELSFPSQGQGHATTVAQLVADRLGVDLEAVTVCQPDTDLTPSGSGTFASRGAIAMSGAADGAARRVRDRLLTLGAARLEASAADLELTAGEVRVRGVPGRGVPIGELVPGGSPLAECEVFDLPGPTFSGAVHVAAVEVDAGTGRVTVRGYTVIEDCGPVINPLVVEGQIHGALSHGIAEALGEPLVYDAEGQLLTGTLMDYALPVAADTPSFTVGHVETPSPLTPGGYKGMGEGGTIGAPAAIANAVADAVRPLGLTVTRLPLRAEDLRRR